MIAVVLLIGHFIIVPRDLTEFNIGKPLGFYALILILIGVIISAAPPLKKKIPYNKWINFHKLMGVFYVMAVAHGMIVHSLIKELPITRVYVFGMAAIGISAWIYRAFLYRLFNKQLDYTVSSVQNLGQGIAEIKLKPDGDNLIFRAGQFAFFTFPTLSKREQHPFTISSHPYQDGLRITVKGLGDYTDDFSTKIKEGDPVKVEGPFGHFSTKYVKELEQVWIAGGIGITPFLSLDRDIYTNKVKLYWCVKNKEEAVYTEELSAVSKDNPNFEFVIWNSDEKGHLTIDKLNVTDYKTKAFLLCGPQTLKTNVFNQLEKKGVKRDLIYDEEFTFR
jgi:predicted ferric reductase